MPLEQLYLTGPSCLPDVIVRRQTEMVLQEQKYGLAAVCFAEPEEVKHANLDI